MKVAFFEARKTKVFRNVETLLLQLLCRCCGEKVIGADQSRTLYGYGIQKGRESGAFSLEDFLRFHITGKKEKIRIHGKTGISKSKEPAVEPIRIGLCARREKTCYFFVSARGQLPDKNSGPLR